MLRRDDDHKFVTVDQNHRQARIADRHGNYSEIDGVIDHRIQNFGIVGALYIDGDIGILLLELGEDLGKNVQTRSFVGADDDFPSRYALSFGNGGEDRFAGVQSFLSIFLEELTSGGNGNFAAGTVEYPGSNFLLQRADLRRDGRLGAEALLR